MIPISGKPQCNGKNKYSKNEAEHTKAEHTKAVVGRFRDKSMRIYKCPECYYYHITKNFFLGKIQLIEICHKKKFFIHRPEVILPIGAKAKSQKMMCNSCAKAITNAFNKPISHGTTSRPHPNRVRPSKKP